MNKKLEEFKKNIKNKNVAVIGIAVSNIPAIKYLDKIGAKVTAFDGYSREKIGSVCEELENLGIKLVLGDNYLDNIEGFDYIFRSPGVKPFLPEIEEAVNNGTILTSEIEMLVELAPCKVIGVTGSDGKTTTTTLISKFITEDGKKCFLGGNIGTPLFDNLDEMSEDDIVVLELSSFQLMTMKKSPNVSVITNLSPNHLDYHRSYEEYLEAKTNIFLHQNEDDIVVLNKDDKETEGFENLINGHLRLFSLKEKINNGAYCINNKIMLNNGENILEIEDVKNIVLPGKHNIANICTAITAVYDLVSVEAIKKVITTFKGVEHRIELVRELDGVKYYNSSIDSSQYRTIATLNVFEQKVILIAGGKDKGIPYEELGPVIIDKVKKLILIGATAEKIKESLEKTQKETGKVNDIEMFFCNTYEEVVRKAKEISVNGDIVILSPASTSFDMFKNFEERGNTFKKLVNEL